jgi:arabinan endo-1,5-alpha-L-arabinosidase
VLDADFPDPTVLRASDGFYYAYATQTEVRRPDGPAATVNVQVARSRDLVRWDRLGDALPAKPRWASRTQDFWAPHVSEHAGRYYLYYSAKPDTALATPPRGSASPWPPPRVRPARSPTWGARSSAGRAS